MEIKQVIPSCLDPFTPIVYTRIANVQLLVLDIPWHDAYIRYNQEKENYYSQHPELAQDDKLTHPIGIPKRANIVHLEWQPSGTGVLAVCIARCIFLLHPVSKEFLVVKIQQSAPHLLSHLNFVRKTCKHIGKRSQDADINDQPALGDRKDYFKIFHSSESKFQTGDTPDPSERISQPTINKREPMIEEYIPVHSTQNVNSHNTFSGYPLTAFPSIHQDSVKNHSSFAFDKDNSTICSTMIPSFILFNPLLSVPSIYSEEIVELEDIIFKQRLSIFLEYEPTSVSFNFLHKQGEFLLVSGESLSLWRLKNPNTISDHQLEHDLDKTCLYFVSQASTQSHKSTIPNIHERYNERIDQFISPAQSSYKQHKMMRDTEDGHDLNPSDISSATNLDMGQATVIHDDHDDIGHHHCHKQKLATRVVDYLKNPTNSDDIHGQVTSEESNPNDPKAKSQADSSFSITEGHGNAMVDHLSSSSQSRSEHSDHDHSSYNSNADSINCPWGRAWEWFQDEDENGQSLYSPMQPFRLLWQRECPATHRVTFSPDDRIFATVGFHDRNVKVWHYGVHGLSFIYLSHPRSVKNIQWRHFPATRAFCQNVLLSHLVDGTCSIWIETEPYRRFQFSLLLRLSDVFTSAQWLCTPLDILANFLQNQELELNDSYPINSLDQPISMETVKNLCSSFPKSSKLGKQSSSCLHSQLPHEPSNDASSTPNCNSNCFDCLHRFRAIHHTDQILFTPVVTCPNKTQDWIVTFQTDGTFLIWRIDDLIIPKRSPKISLWVSIKNVLQSTVNDFYPQILVCCELYSLQNRIYHPSTLSIFMSSASGRDISCLRVRTFNQSKDQVNLVHRLQGHVGPIEHLQIHPSLPLISSSDPTETMVWKNFDTNISDSSTILEHFTTLPHSSLMKWDYVDPIIYAYTDAILMNGSQDTSDVSIHSDVNEKDGRERHHHHHRHHHSGHAHHSHHHRSKSNRRSSASAECPMKNMRALLASEFKKDLNLLVTSESFKKHHQQTGKHQLVAYLVGKFEDSHLTDSSEKISAVLADSNILQDDMGNAITLGYLENLPPVYFYDGQRFDLPRNQSLILGVSKDGQFVFIWQVYKTFSSANYNPISNKHLGDDGYHINYIDTWFYDFLHNHNQSSSPRLFGTYYNNSSMCSHSAFDCLRGVGLECTMDNPNHPRLDLNSHINTSNSNISSIGYDHSNHSFLFSKNNGLNLSNNSLRYSNAMQSSSPHLSKISECVSPTSNIPSPKLEYASKNGVSVESQLIVRYKLPIEFKISCLAIPSSTHFYGSTKHLADVSLFTGSIDGVVRAWRLTLGSGPSGCHPINSSSVSQSGISSSLYTPSLLNTSSSSNSVHTASNSSYNSNWYWTPFLYFRASDTPIASIKCSSSSRLATLSSDADGIKIWESESSSPNFLLETIIPINVNHTKYRPSNYDQTYKVNNIQQSTTTIQEKIVGKKDGTPLSNTWYKYGTSSLKITLPDNRTLSDIQGNRFNPEVEYQIDKDHLWNISLIEHFSDSVKNHHVSHINELSNTTWPLWNSLSLRTGILSTLYPCHIGTRVIKVLHAYYKHFHKCILQTFTLQDLENEKQQRLLFPGSKLPSIISLNLFPSMKEPKSTPPPPFNNSDDEINKFGYSNENNIKNCLKCGISGITLNSIIGALSYCQDIKQLLIMLKYCQWYYLGVLLPPYPKQPSLEYLDVDSRSKSSQHLSFDTLYNSSFNATYKQTITESRDQFKGHLITKLVSNGRYSLGDADICQVPTQNQTKVMSGTFKAPINDSLANKSQELSTKNIGISFDWIMGPTGIPILSVISEHDRLSLWGLKSPDTLFDYNPNWKLMSSFSLSGLNVAWTIYGQLVVSSHSDLHIFGNFLTESTTFITKSQQWHLELPFYHPKCLVELIMAGRIDRVYTIFRELYNAVKTLLPRLSFLRKQSGLTIESLTSDEKKGENESLSSRKLVDGQIYEGEFDDGVDSTDLNRNKPEKIILNQIQQLELEGPNGLELEEQLEFLKILATAHHIVTQSYGYSETLFSLHNFPGSTNQVSEVPESNIVNKTGYNQGSMLSTTPALVHSNEEACQVQGSQSDYLASDASQSLKETTTSVHSFDTDVDFDYSTFNVSNPTFSEDYSADWIDYKSDSQIHHPSTSISSSQQQLEIDSCSDNTKTETSSTKTQERTSSASTLDFNNSVHRTASPSDSSITKFNTLTEFELNQLCLALDQITLPNLSQTDHDYLIVLILTLIDLEKISLDLSAVRFIVLARLFIWNQSQTNSFDTLLPSSNWHWALHATDQKTLVNFFLSSPSNRSTSNPIPTSEDSSNIHRFISHPQTLWPFVRSLGIPIWCNDVNSLKEICLQLATNHFLLNKEPSDAAIWYLLLGKKSTLAAMYKIKNQDKFYAFFSNDFSLERWSKAAQTNAYVLMSKQQFQMSVGLFILAGKISEAIHLCLTKLKDIVLAFFVVRIVEVQPFGPHYKHLIEMALQQASDDGDHTFESLLIWLKQEYKSAFFSLVPQKCYKTTVLLPEIEDKDDSAIKNGYDNPVDGNSKSDALAKHEIHNMQDRSKQSSNHNHDFDQLPVLNNSFEFPNVKNRDALTTTIQDYDCISSHPSNIHQEYADLNLSSFSHSSSFLAPEFTKNRMFQYHKKKNLYPKHVSNIVSTLSFNPFILNLVDFMLEIPLLKMALRRNHGPNSSDSLHFSSSNYFKQENKAMDDKTEFIDSQDQSQTTSTGKHFSRLDLHPSIWCLPHHSPSETRLNRLFDILSNDQTPAHLELDATGKLLRNILWQRVLYVHLHSGMNRLIIQHHFDKLKEQNDTIQKYLKKPEYMIRLFTSHPDIIANLDHNLMANLSFLYHSSDENESLLDKFEQILRRLNESLIAGTSNEPTSCEFRFHSASQFLSADILNAHSCPSIQLSCLDHILKIFNSISFCGSRFHPYAILLELYQFLHSCTNLYLQYNLLFKMKSFFRDAIESFMSGNSPFLQGMPFISLPDDSITTLNDGPIKEKGLSANASHQLPDITSKKQYNSASGAHNNGHELMPSLTPLNDDHLKEDTANLEHLASLASKIDDSRDHMLASSKPHYNHSPKIPPLFTNEHCFGKELLTLGSFSTSDNGNLLNNSYSCLCSISINEMKNSSQIDKNKTNFSSSDSTISNSLDQRLDSQKCLSLSQGIHAAPIQPRASNASINALMSLPLSNFRFTNASLEISFSLLCAAKNLTFQCNSLFVKNMRSTHHSGRILKYCHDLERVSEHHFSNLNDSFSVNIHSFISASTRLALFVAFWYQCNFENMFQLLNVKDGKHQDDHHLEEELLSLSKNSINTESEAGTNDAKRPSTHQHPISILHGYHFRPKHHKKYRLSNTDGAHQLSPTWMKNNQLFKVNQNSVPLLRPDFHLDLHTELFLDRLFLNFLLVRFTYQQEALFSQCALVIQESILLKMLHSWIAQLEDDLFFIPLTIIHECLDLIKTQINFSFNVAFFTPFIQHTTNYKNNPSVYRLWHILANDIKIDTYLHETGCLDQSIRFVRHRYGLLEDIIIQEAADEPRIFDILTSEVLKSQHLSSSKSSQSDHLRHRSSSLHAEHLSLDTNLGDSSSIEGGYCEPYVVRRTRLMEKLQIQRGQPLGHSKLHRLSGLLTNLLNKHPMSASALKLTEELVLYKAKGIISGFCINPMRPNQLALATSNGIVELIVLPSVLSLASSHGLSSSDYGRVSALDELPSLESPSSRNNDHTKSSLHMKDHEDDLSSHSLESNGFNHYFISDITEPTEEKCDPCTCVAVHPTNPYYLSGGQDATIRLWQFNVAFSLNTYSTTKNGYITSLKFNYNGNKFASLTNKGILELWNFGIIDESSRPYFLNPSLKKGKHLTYVNSASVIAVAGQGNVRGANVAVIDSLIPSSKATVKTFATHQDAVASFVTYSCRHQYFLIGDQRGNIVIYDARMDQLMATWELAHHYSIKGLSLDPMQKYLVSASSDGSVKFWDLNTFELVNSWPSAHLSKTFGARTGLAVNGVTQLTIADDMLYSSGADRKLKLRRFLF